MTNANAVGGALEGSDGSAVIDARNERAVETLRNSIDQGAARLAIFYGVAHMPDFERRLQGELGFEYRSTRWVNAWRFAGAEQSVLSESEGQ